MAEEVARKFFTDFLRGEEKAKVIYDLSLGEIESVLTEEGYDVDEHEIEGQELNLTALYTHNETGCTVLVRAELYYTEKGFLVTKL